MGTGERVVKPFLGTATLLDQLAQEDTMKLLICVLLLCIPAPVLAQDKPDSVFRASLVAAIAAHGADLATTEFCLGAKRCMEQNKFLARFDQPAVFGAVKMGLAGLQLWGTAKLHERNRTLAILVNIASTAVYTGIAIHNTRQGQ